MKHVWSVICLNYIVDKETGNLSLIDIPNRLGFRGELPDTRPFELPLPSPFFLVSTWRRSGDKKESTETVLVKIYGPNDKVIGDFEVSVPFTDSQLHRTYGKTNSILYQEDGLHRFEICIKEDGEWSPVASIPLELVHEQPEPEQESEFD